MNLSLSVLQTLFAPRRAAAAAAAPLSDIRAILRRLLRLGLSIESHRHFTQDLLTSPPRDVTIPGIHTTTIDSLDHTDFPKMLAIAREQGLDPDWCREQLDEGATCGVALLREQDGRDRPVGMGMLRTGPFWVEEIGHRFVPGPRGAYLYALYVSPPFRGRGIQGLLISQRFRTALAQGRRYAYAMVLNTNAPSINGHLAQGARVSARIDCLRFGPLHLSSVRKVRTSLPIGSFTHDGFPRRGSIHVRFLR